MLAALLLWRKPQRDSNVAGSEQEKARV